MARWQFALVIAAGLAVGAGSAVVYMRQGMAPAGGGWMGSKVTGSVDADAWTRARVAVSGLLALNRGQALYFVRKTDEAGRPLRENCRYRVAGGALPGRWWSVTVYAPDNFLPRNDDGALSFDATRVHPDAAGQWQAVAASHPVPGAVWVSTRRAGQFDLTLRIYNPTPAAQADFTTIALPSVTRIGCEGGQGA
ncbi:DUF1214 domain-containing protein [Novosphingobium sp. FSW06-99]|uniref:DUF1214 domain-containing protein n=1 Tax=Novosphingobium sp. FSW06-99 TaxID=1739113 RepID=UPI00076C00AB|nr:DUF1214 domain-containing protein [Novosphingobium sp. FSW06-99]KUR77741.1 hypothetical protein AQZ49_09625 [Novosphingobium sp. FSW06-99]